MKRSLSILLLALLVPAMPAQAGPGGPQDQARRDFRAGNILSIRDIEGIVVPQMQGTQYLGFEYDPAAHAYRLKFIRDGRVIFVDVDARTGDVIRKTG